jgi:peptidoglycan/LPS O-acetylase OafA/YrhL
MAVSVILQATFIDGGRPALTLLNYFQFFAGGLLLADVYLLDWEEDPPTSRHWDIFALLGWPTLVFVLHSSVGRRLLFLPLLIALFGATFRGPFTRRAFRQRWLVTIGGMCYSIYLLHYPLISMIGRVWKSLVPPIASTALYVVVTATAMVSVVLIVSGIFFVLVERPCMKRDWWKDVARRGPQVPEAPATPSA